jgi:nucleotide-binding universal stress UspA family protein
MPGIVVGVDGSDHSRRSLRWAMQEAVLRHAPLTVITVRPDQVRPATTIYWGLRTSPENTQAEDLAAQKALQQTVDEVASEIGGTAPEVTVRVANGNPAEELVRASRDADLLVLGSRGIGGFGKLMLGSVSSQVTHHAECPVVIVPGLRPALPGRAETG